ncbi:MAG: LemA family protein [Lautropia sp.]
MDSSISVAIALGVFFVWALVIYNRLVALRNRVANGLAQIDVQLKRRHDLIPNLIETAREYLSHERQTLEAVVSARAAAQAARQAGTRDAGDEPAMAAMASAEGALSSSLGSLFALAEASPDLKANQTMMQLSEEITKTENKLSFTRQSFNDAVMHFNTALESFPAVMFAGTLGFKRSVMLAPLNLAIERNVPAVRL